MFGGFRGPESMFGSYGGGATMGTRKAKPVENRLPCTLEDLYKGTTKKMKISRNIADISGYVQRHPQPFFVLLCDCKSNSLWGSFFEHPDPFRWITISAYILSIDWWSLHLLGLALHITSFLPISNLIYSHQMLPNFQKIISFLFSFIGLIFVWLSSLSFKAFDCMQ